MTLAIKRRDTLIKRLNQARAKYDDVKCDQIMMQLQGENEIIGDCKTNYGDNRMNTITYNYTDGTAISEEYIDLNDNWFNECKNKAINQYNKAIWKSIVVDTYEEGISFRSQHLNM